MHANCKRLFSFLIALVLVVSCLPAAVFATSTPDLPTATVKEIENENLTFAMNFTADEATEEQLAYYGKWYADFVLTVNTDVTFDANGNGDGYLSGHYDKWSRSWVDVPGTAVTVAANEPLRIMEFASDLLGKKGMKYNFNEIYNDVKSFDCGVYFEPEFLGANPDLVVTLELRVYDIADESNTYVIGETYTFTNPAVVKNTRTGLGYGDLSDAVWNAAAGDTLVMLRDTSVMDLSVYENVTLDLNGHSVEAKYATVYGNLVDNSADNSGRLAVSPDRFMFRSGNKQLPVYTGEDFCFVDMTGFNTGMRNANTFAFQPLFETYAHQFMLSGAAAAEVSVQVEMSWIREGNVRRQSVIYNDDLIREFIGSARPNGGYNSIFTLTIANLADFEDLVFTAKVVSSVGVELTSDDGGNVQTDGNGQMVESVTLENGSNSAFVSKGTKVQANAKNLTLSTTEMSESTSSITAADGETLYALDVHVDGLSKDNTVPVIVTLNQLAPEAMNQGNISLYHVENGVTIEMTRVYSLAELDAHNEFYYDIATGTVSVALASFSEITLLTDDANIWQGEMNTEWYDNEKTNFEIFNADQLAGFGALVDAGNTFEGKTVTLCMDVKLSDGSHAEGTRSFDPIGFSYEFADKAGYTNPGQVFKGTFNGNGNTIYGLYQNGWDLGYSYGMQGGGLFASVVNATIKNLTMDNAYIVMECIDMGTVVGYANGNCTFENIVVKNSTLGNYQRYTGGAIGEVGNGHHILKNVDVDANTTVSSLWGDFDASLGGIIGGKWAHNYTNDMGKNNQKVSVYMENCDVAARLDAYNDVTSAYQWYSYRRCGMLIGNSAESKSVNGRTEATASYLETVNCTVQYGDWATYHYCEFGNTTSLGARYPWVRVEANKNGFNGAYSNPRYGNPIVDGVAVNTDNHDEYHIAADGHNVEIVLNQLYGGGQGCYGGNSHIDNGVTIIGKDGAITPSQKFVYIGAETITTDTTLTLGQLFETTTGIMGANVYAFVSPADEDSSVKAVSVTHSEPNENWQDLELTFTGTGAAKITISDYYYCVPTTITVIVNEESFAPGFYKVTDASEILSGGQFVIVAEVDGQNLAMNTTVTSSRIASTQVSVVNDQAQGTSVPVWTIVKNENGILLQSDDYKLGWASGTDFDNSGDTWYITENGDTNTFTVTLDSVWDNTKDNQTRGIFYRTKDANKEYNVFRPYSTTNLKDDGSPNAGYYPYLTFYKWYDAPACEHEWNDGEVTKAATCKEEGVKTYTCSLCHNTKTESINKLPHTEVTVEGKDATCTETGLTEGTKCSVCDTVIKAQDIIATVPHSYSTVVTAPTCTEDGYTTYTCTCGDTYTDNVVPATGHNYSNGTYGTCVNCGDVKEDDVKYYTVIFMANGTEFDKVDVIAGEKVEKPENPKVYSGYTFEGWTLDKDATTNDLYDFESSINSDITLYALYKQEGTGNDGYQKVTDVSALAEGDSVVIVAKDYNYALSTTQNNNNRGQAAVSKNGNAVTLTSSVQVLTLQKGKVDGTFAFYTGKGYLYAASSGSNYLKTETTLSNNSSWKITIAADGTATIVAQGNYTRNTMQYNQGSSLFACYSSASQKAIVIYKLFNGEDVYTTDAKCKHTNIQDDIIKAATCTEPGSKNIVCADCGEIRGTEEIPATGHDFSNGDCTCGAAKPDATEKTVTMNIYANKGSLSNNVITWTYDSVSFVNTKGSTAIRTDDSNHYRVYQGSKVTISASGKAITKVVITCTSDSYATVMQTSLKNAGYTATVSGSVVTVVLSNNITEITFTASAQTRLNKIEVTYNG